MKIQLILITLFLVGFVNPPEKEKLRIKNFEIEIPEVLERVGPNDRYNELLSLRYKNELKILIGDDIGSPDKDAERKKMYDALDLLTSTFELKFLKWFNTYDGMEKGELRKDNINSFKARTRDFKTNIKGTIYYFEISTINIGNYFFDIIVTGKDELREEHKSIVDELLNSIKKVSEN